MVDLGGEGRGEGRRIGGMAANAPEQEYRGREEGDPLREIDKTAAPLFGRAPSLFLFVSRH